MALVGSYGRGMRRCSRDCSSSSGNNNLIEKINGEIFDVRGNLKKLTVASLFAAFLSGGKQLLPLNVSVGWGESMSLYKQGLHSEQK